MKATKFSYKTGDPVWAKVAGYPWWPGRVISPQEVVLEPGDVLPKIPEDSFIVEFFNNGKRFSIVPKSKLRPFLHRRFHEINATYKGALREHVDGAVEESEQYVTAHGLQYIGCTKKAKKTKKTKKRKENPGSSDPAPRAVKPKIQEGDQVAGPRNSGISPSNTKPAPSTPLPRLPRGTQVNGRTPGAPAPSTSKANGLKNPLPKGSTPRAPAPPSAPQTNQFGSIPTTGIKPVAPPLPVLERVQSHGTPLAPRSAPRANRKLKGGPSTSNSRGGPSPPVPPATRPRSTTSNPATLRHESQAGATCNEISALRDMAYSGELSNEHLYASESKSTLIYLVSEYEKELRFFRLAGLQRAAQSTGVVSEMADFIWICAPAFVEVNDFIKMNENAADKADRDRAEEKALEKLRKLSNMPVLPSLLRSQHSVMRRGLKLATRAVAYSKTVAVFMRNLCIQWLDIAGGPNPS